MAGFKLKTRKSAAKRFWKASATGKIRRAKAAHGHFLSRRGQKARLSQGATLVNDSNYEQVNKLVPALGAKRKRSRAIKNALRRMLIAAGKIVVGVTETTAKVAPKAAAKPAVKTADKAAAVKKAAPKTTKTKATATAAASN